MTPSQWWCVVQGLWARAQRVNLALVSASVAFFGLMAVILGMATLAAFLGLTGDPQLITGLLQALHRIANDGGA